MSPTKRKRGRNQANVAVKPRQQQQQLEKKETSIVHCLAKPPDCVSIGEESSNSSESAKMADDGNDTLSSIIASVAAGSGSLKAPSTTIGSRPDSPVQRQNFFEPITPVKSTKSTPVKSGGGRRGSRPTLSPTKSLILPTEDESNSSFEAISSPHQYTRHIHVQGQMNESEFSPTGSTIHHVVSKGRATTVRDLVKVKSPALFQQSIGAGWSGSPSYPGQQPNTTTVYNIQQRGFGDRQGEISHPAPHVIVEDHGARPRQRVGVLGQLLLF